VSDLSTSHRGMTSYLEISDQFVIENILATPSRVDPMTPRGFILLSFTLLLFFMTVLLYTKN
jgi:hypothetical protein